ncbi:MAG: DUF2924 domain-containing protein, partial [Alphaproteobacteria bacterium]|nr:DUF2924 domain-containing protein [Alphaproteobacteria bacterium]
QPTRSRPRKRAASPTSLRGGSILHADYPSEGVSIARRITPRTRRIRTDRKPIAGTRLLREFQGVEHIVTVTIEGYEYRGRPYKSLSAIARAITGVQWNGWVFFGLKSAGSGT